MTRLTCVLIGFSTGCYLSHQVGDPPAPPLGVDGGRPADAGRPPDSGPPPPPFSCRMQRRGDVVVRAPRTHQAQAPDVHWDGARLGVVMMEGGGDTDHPELTLARIAPDLSTVSDPIRVGEQAHGWGETDWAGDRLAVCYHGDPGGPGRTMFRTVAGDGSLGPLRDIDVDGEACLALVVAGETAFLGWRHRVETEEGFAIQTLVAPVSLDGELLAEPMDLGSAPYPGRTVHLAADGDGALAAIATDEGVRVVRLDARGAVLDEHRMDLPGAISAAVATGPGGDVGLATMTGPREARSLSFALLDRSLFAAAPQRRIADGAPSALSARVASAPDGWWITWASGNRPSTRAMLLHVDRAGNAVEPRFTFHDGLNSGYGGPSLVRVERDLYVGLSASGASSEEVHLQRWSCEEAPHERCAAQDAMDMGCDESGELPRWRWTGARCALVSCPSACAGEDCADLAPSRFACESDHATCAMAPACRGALIAAPPTRACVARATVRDDEPMVVTLSAEVECPCALALACDARVMGPFEIELDTRACQEMVECEPCAPGTIETLRARCELPPLGVGTWSIRRGGEELLSLEVVPRWEMPSGDEVCSP